MSRSDAARATPRSAAVATVIVVTASDVTWEVLAAALRDEMTVLQRIAHPAALDDVAQPDVVIVDRVALGASDRLLWRLRKRWPTVGILVQGALGDAEVARLLDAGADDAVPHGSVVSTARMAALVRRARTVNAGQRVVLGDIVYDREAGRLWCASREVKLTPTEEALVDCLFWHSPEVVAVDTLARRIWQRAPNDQCRALLRMYVSYLRRKLSGSRLTAILTVRDVGYALRVK